MPLRGLVLCRGSGLFCSVTLPGTLSGMGLVWRGCTDRSSKLGSALALLLLWLPFSSCSQPQARPCPLGARTAPEWPGLICSSLCLLVCLHTNLSYLSWTQKGYHFSLKTWWLSIAEFIPSSLARSHLQCPLCALPFFVLTSVPCPLHSAHGTFTALLIILSLFSPFTCWWFVARVGSCSWNQVPWSFPCCCVPWAPLAVTSFICAHFLPVLSEPWASLTWPTLVLNWVGLKVDRRVRCRNASGFYL